MSDDKETKGKQEIAATKNSSPSVVPKSNPYQEYADEALSSNIEGHLFKYVKGDWVFGKESKAVPIGTRFVANMESARVGWLKWSNGGVADCRMGRIVDRFKPPQRNDLGDNDSDLWEMDQDDKPKDPWQFTNELVMAALKDGEIFTFSTATNGGRKAFDLLTKKYARELSRHPDDWPIIEVGSDSYLHPNKAYGRIKEPTFTIVGWIGKDDKGPAPTPVPAPKPAPAPAEHLSKPTLRPAPSLYEDGDPLEYEDVPISAERDFEP